MKKILALLVAISLFADIPVGGMGNNVSGTEDSTQSTEIEVDDKVKTEESFWGLVKKLPKDNCYVSNGVIYYTGYDKLDNAYMDVIGLIADKGERLKFSEKGKYMSDNLIVEYVADKKNTSFELKIKFLNRKGYPEYKVVFMVKD